MLRLLSLLVASFTIATVALAADEPITAIERDAADKFDFKGGSATKPKLISDEKELAKAITDEDTAKRLGKLVDFKKQMLLVFIWQGSGQDKLDYTVAESFPEQIQFAYKRGFTKDLREHVHIYVLRNNVKWSVK